MIESSLPEVSRLNPGLDNDKVGVFYSKENVVKSKSYKFYINGSISRDKEDSPWLPQLIETLTTVTENDLIDLYVNSPGGEVYTALQIRNLLKKCPAKINIFISGLCASAATIITLGLSTGENRISLDIDEYTAFLFHNGFSFELGKPNDNFDSAEFYLTLLEAVMSEAYEDVLTSKELKAVLQGKEFYLLGSDVISRMKKKKRS